MVSVGYCEKSAFSSSKLSMDCFEVDAPSNEIGLSEGCDCNDPSANKLSMITWPSCESFKLGLAAIGRRCLGRAPRDGPGFLFSLEYSQGQLASEQREHCGRCKSPTTNK